MFGKYVENITASDPEQLVETGFSRKNNRKRVIFYSIPQKDRLN
jgi:hypothetical protein